MQQPIIGCAALDPEWLSPGAASGNTASFVSWLEVVKGVPVGVICFVS